MRRASRTLIGDAIGSAVQLGKGRGSDVSRGTTGPIEVYHALCFLFGSEPLGAPVALVVWGLVADFESHGSFADVLTIRPPGGKPGGRCSVSELDRIGSRCADHLVMGGAVFDACLFNVGNDGLQDLQDLSAIGGTVEQGGCQVAGHARIAG